MLVYRDEYMQEEGITALNLVSQYQLMCLFNWDGDLEVIVCQH